MTVSNANSAHRQRIVPHFWFDTQAVEAAEFYVDVFPDSAIDSVRTIRNTPSGDCDLVEFRLAGFEFAAISAGPMFTINPSISFMVNFDPSHDASARENLDVMWDSLADGGTVRMALDAYPFSERYGWVRDRFGVEWQLILTNPSGDDRPFIITSLMFTGENLGNARSALDFYASVFEDSQAGQLVPWGEAGPPGTAEMLMFSDFSLAGQWFTAMDSPADHGFGFNEAVSLIVKCDNQQQLNDYWHKLTDGGQEVECGWLTDRFGVSWQVVPREMDEMMASGTPEQLDRVTQAFLKMVKFDIEKLRQAYNS
ncbi:MAG: VOC family protein [Actinomycetes bacterium]